MGQRDSWRNEKTRPGGPDGSRRAVAALRGSYSGIPDHARPSPATREAVVVVNVVVEALRHWAELNGDCVSRQRGTGVRHTEGTSNTLSVLELAEPRDCDIFHNLPDIRRLQRPSHFFLVRPGGFSQCSSRV